MMRHSNKSDPEDNYNDSDEGNPKFPIEFKYILMIITIINFIISIIVEQCVIPCIKKCWMKNQIKGIEKAINKKEKEVDLNMINEVKNYTIIHKAPKKIMKAPKKPLKFDE
jgi:hypothetical protein